ncbi:hypothetical protein V6N11_033554 [Hibiscus sabdariffa]|uniref:Uncharacterized protein n=1 Tax=Hibiscus sabdariffa TaxID=183260 RepID=A0ABR2PYD6_9ROSI
MARLTWRGTPEYRRYIDPPLDIRDILISDRTDLHSGAIPLSLGNLSKLESLSLFDNQISGRIPSSLFKCKELQFLSASSNHLEGSLEVEIGDLSMLQFLYIGQNQFEGNVY